MKARTQPPTKGIFRLRLQARDLGPLRAFYLETLKFQVIRDDADGLSLAAGGTELTFVATDRGSPIYHFAFNIPGNKLAAALDWLRPRAPIHREPDGSEIIDFASWNAHAIYFYDPAGNILEFIARHNLPNAAEGEFNERDILYASEIGIVVDDVASAVHAARRDWGLAVFAGTQSEDFAAVGTDEALLIFAKRGRPWFGGDGAEADVFETEAAFSGDRNAELKLPGLPYTLAMNQQ